MSTMDSQQVAIDPKEKFYRQFQISVGSKPLSRS